MNSSLNPFEIPVGRDPQEPPRRTAPGEIIVSVYDGIVECVAVLGNGPIHRAIVVDFDVEGSDLDSPHMIVAESENGRVLAHVAEIEIGRRILGKSDLGSALKAARKGGVI